MLVWLICNWASFILQVPLDSCRGLSKLDSIYTSLLTSDEGGGFSDDLPSGICQVKLLVAGKAMMLHS